MLQGVNRANHAEHPRQLGVMYGVRGQPRAKPAVIRSAPLLVTSTGVANVVPPPGKSARREDEPSRPANRSPPHSELTPGCELQLQ